MPLDPISLQQLLEAGVHFGHHKRRWNPKMKPYIYGVHKGIHIIDLEKTLPLLKRAATAIRETVINHGRVLFVGTKRAAQTYIAEAAKKCGQFYINHRWLGGMLTNWKTVSLSLQRLYDLEEKLNQPQTGLTKKELLKLSLQRDKLEHILGGIRNITKIPDILFIIDTNQESIAIKEAAKLKIPLIAVVDTNSTPENITYPIPGNDDAIRAIETYCHIMAQAVLDGLNQQLINDGIILPDVNFQQQEQEQSQETAVQQQQEQSQETAVQQQQEQSQETAVQQQQIQSQETTVQQQQIQSQETTVQQQQIQSQETTSQQQQIQSQETAVQQQQIQSQETTVQQQQIQSQETAVQQQQIQSQGTSPAKGLRIQKTEIQKRNQPKKTTKKEESK